MKRSTDIPEVETIPVDVYSNPFRSRRSQRAYAAKGTSILEMVQANPSASSCIYEVRVGNDLVPQEWWQHVKPKAGVPVELYAVPLDGKNPLQVILQVALVAAAIVVPQFLPYASAYIIGASGATWAAVYTAAILSVGGLLINALVPPPSPSFGGNERENRYLLNSTSNQILPFQGRPLLLGRYRCFPPHAALPYTIVSGEDNYINMALEVSYGPIEYGDVKIGDTPIVNYDDVILTQLQGYVEDEHPIRGFKNALIEESIQIELTKENTDPFDVSNNANDGTYVQRLVPGARAFSTDIYFPQGLNRRNDEGKLRPYSVKFRVWYREVGDSGPWTAVSETGYDRTVWQHVGAPGTGRYEVVHDVTEGYIHIEDEDPSPVLRSYLFAIEDTDLGNKQFDIAVRRVTGGESVATGGSKENIFDLAQWITYRSYLHQRPFDHTGRALMALQIRANEQLRGSLDNVNCIATSICLDWHGASGGDNYVDLEATDSTFETSSGDQEGFERNNSSFGSAVRTTDEAYEGTYSCQVSQAGTGLAPISIRKTVTFTNKLAGGTKWRASGWFLGNATSTNGVNIVVRCRFIDSTGGNPTVASTKTVALSLTWQYIETEMELSAEEARMYDQVQWTANIESGSQSDTDVWYCDNVSLQPLWHERATENPASLFRYVLQGPMRQRPIPFSMVPLGPLEEWWEFCDARGLTYGRYLLGEQPNTLDLLREICAVGCAAFSQPDGNFSVILDVAQNTVKQAFSPRNSWEFKASKVFPDLPHAYRAEFIDKEFDEYQPAERIIYFDGYRASNATVFEQLQLPGVTDPDQAYSLARYYQAQIKLRPETVTLKTDIENLRCHQGALVEYASDAMLIGLGAGRVISTTVNGSGETLTITFDFEVEMAGGTSYAVMVRFDTLDVSSEYPVNTVAGSPQTTVTLTDPIPAAAPQPAAGDLIFFGVAERVTARYIVKNIEHEKGLVARLTLVDEAPSIHDSLQGEIPAYDPHLTNQRPSRVSVPKPPQIKDVISDETVLLESINGELIPRIKLTLGLRKSGPKFIDPSHYEIQIRNASFDSDSFAMDSLEGASIQYSATHGRGQWRSVGTFSVSDKVFFIAGVYEGTTYQIRARCISEFGKTSEWTSTEHTVVGKLSPPPDVTYAFLENGRFQWVYTDPPIDLEGFEVRYRSESIPAWDGSPVVATVGKNERYVLLDEVPPGANCLMVRAVDKAGVYSAGTGYIVGSLDPLRTSLRSYVTASFIHTHTWPGTKTNCDTDTPGIGVLKADEVSDSSYWQSDTATFWTGTDADLFYTTLYLAMSYELDFTIVEDEDPALLMIIDYLAGGNLVIPEYRSESEELFWGIDSGAAFWTNDSADFWAALEDWRPWPGYITPKRKKYYFRISIAGGVKQGQLAYVQIQCAYKLHNQSLNDVSIAAGGTRLPVTDTFRVITNVNLTLQSTASAAISAVLKDKNVSGPLVACIDKDANDVGGSVDALVWGY